MHQKPHISHRRKNTTNRSKMFVSNMKLLFICALLQFSQMTTAERAEDGKALFFGLPVQPRVKGGTTEPLNTLVKAALLAAEANEGEENPPLEIIPGKKLWSEPASDSATPEPSLTTVPESVAMEFPKEDPINLIPNLLQTDETASNSQRETPNAVALAAIIRSAVALARPLAGPRLAPLQNFISKTGRDPLKELLSLAETLVGRLGNTITKQNPLDFLKIIDTMQNTIDRMGGEDECTPVIELMDQTVVSLKELLGTMNAVQKLGEMWGSVKMSAIRKCIAKPAGFTGEASHNAEEVEEVPVTLT